MVIVRWHGRHLTHEPWWQSVASLQRTLYPASASTGMFFRNWPKLAPKPCTSSSGGPSPATWSAAQRSPRQPVRLLPRQRPGGGPVGRRAVAHRILYPPTILPFPLATLPRLLRRLRGCDRLLSGGQPPQSLPLLLFGPADRGSAAVPSRKARGERGCGAPRRGTAGDRSYRRARPPDKCGAARQHGCNGNHLLWGPLQLLLRPI